MPRAILKPEPGFIRPGSDWPASPAQTVIETRARIFKGACELARLERSIAFVNGEWVVFDTEKLSDVLEALRQVVDANNFRQIDQALADSFEALTPWAARIVESFQQELIWKCRVEETLLRLLACLSSEHWAQIPGDKAKILRSYQRSAERKVRITELEASIWEREQMALKPSSSKLRRAIAKVKRQVTSKRSLNNV